MLNKETMIEVTNRFGGSLGYTVPDLGIVRHYEPGEKKTIAYEELLKLSYSTGGKNLIKKCMVIHNPEAVQALLGEVEPEYYYTKEDIQYLLLNGSLAQLEDCLDFAEEGVIDLVKQLAVQLNLNDMSKRKAIFDKTGFDVNRAIEINELSNIENEPEKDIPHKRRAAPINQEKNEQPARRTAPPKYKVVSKS